MSYRSFRDRGEDPQRPDFGWRYDIQREHPHGESPSYSIMIAPPTMSQGYKSGLAALDLLRPVIDDANGRKSGVCKVIERHKQYIRTQLEQVGRTIPKGNRWGVIEHGKEGEIEVFEVVRGTESYTVWKSRSGPIVLLNCTSCSGPLSAMKTGCAHCQAVKRYLKRKAREE